MKKILCLLVITMQIPILVAQLPYTTVGTNVTTCYGASAPIACPTDPAEAFYGQFQGVTPSYHDNGDGTITDLNTGLIWIQARGTKTTWDSAFINAENCTTGGYNDWRVPSIKELYSLIDFNGKSGPSASQCIAYLDTNYFQMAYGDLTAGERIIDAQDWSSTQYTGLTMMGDTTIFGVNFVDGRIKGYPKYTPPAFTEGQKMFVRFVRGNANYGINHFVDNGDNTITDSATGLMWMKDDSQLAMNWEAALAWAQEKNSASYLGYNDWRLPNTKELQSIVDYARSKDFTNSAAIDPTFNCTNIADEGGFTNWPWYWSNTTHLDNMYGVYVAFGEALGYMKIPSTATYYTLLDVHGAGVQRSDPKSGSITSYYLGTNQLGDSVYGKGPQGDVIRINNYVRLVRTVSSINGINQHENFELDFNIMPNPASTYVAVTVNFQVTEPVTLSMINSMGSIVKNIYITGPAEAKIEIGKLPKGLYFIVLNSSSKSGVKKLLIN